MQITVIAVGRAKSHSQFQDAMREYEKRITWSLSIIEVESKKKLEGAALKKAEAELIEKQIPKNTRLIMLDERGRNIGSRDFAKIIGNYQRQGDSHLCFIIGGADGFDDNLRKRADLLLSFGQLTWPHMLARVMLLEQIYRAQTILAGHPYHRD
jgi:23S rRNA (pseudouridine1915-N3)-methyltransferase